MTKRSRERNRARGEQTRVINFHIVWIMGNVSLSSKNYTDLSPACNALWIVGGNIVLMNAMTRHISSQHIHRDWRTRARHDARYISLKKKYAQASSREISRRRSFSNFRSLLSSHPSFLLRTTSPIYRHRGITKRKISHFFSSLLFFLSRKIRGKKFEKAF